jgi:hypothetical protein
MTYQMTSHSSYSSHSRRIVTAPYRITDPDPTAIAVKWPMARRRTIDGRQADAAIRERACRRVLRIEYQTLNSGCLDVGLRRMSRGYLVNSQAAVDRYTTVPAQPRVAHWGA